jgi:hypothetical protein
MTAAAVFCGELFSLSEGSRVRRGARCKKQRQGAEWRSPRDWQQRHVSVPRFSAKVIERLMPAH